MIINIHGLVIQCHSSSPELITLIIRPFKYFIKESGQAEFNVYVEEADPPYEKLPQMNASFSTPRNIVFKRGDLKVIDYFGNGIVLEEKKEKKFTIYGRDPDFIQETFYLLILFLFSQFCDDHGLLRIHALTFSRNDTAFIFSAQSGGGKSTMALGLLENDGFKLISDDEAIVTASGDLLSLPLRIGSLDKNRLKSIPSEYVYEIHRMEFGRKYFIDLDYWKDKLEKKQPKRKVFLMATRLLNGPPRIERASKYKTFTNLLGSAVIGLGLYQGMEFVFSSSGWEIFSRLPVFLRRLGAAFRFTMATDSYRIYMSRDSSENVRVLTDFITQKYK